MIKAGGTIGNPGKKGSIWTGEPLEWREWSLGGSFWVRAVPWKSVPIRLVIRRSRFRGNDEGLGFTNSATLGAGGRQDRRTAWGLRG